MRYLLYILIPCFCFWNVRAETDPKFYAVEVSAQVQLAPARVTLSWPGDSNATGYVIQRKAMNDANWGVGSTLPGSATSFADAQVQTGQIYEYQLSKTTTVGYKGYGYITAGLNAPLIEDRGKVLLVVDSTHAPALAAELARLQRDLVGDGWTVVRRDVSRSASPASVKALILSDYYADPGRVKSVFLFGHVPVPYSGNMNPDGHGDHIGAWPADAYYGDVDGTWTDYSVYNTSASKPANHNVPGDGKFDQSNLPSEVDLEVGRVDLANMTCFANKTFARTELDLLRQYLNKDHNFRHRAFSLERRGLVCDNFGERSGEAFAATGWRNFAPLFGASNNKATLPGSYFTTLASEGYLWSYGAGGGGFYTCDGIGSSDNFATSDIRTVFTMFVGSYFGDWDNESAFLRAPLGSTTYTLTSSWSGRPHWYYHAMGIGATIGYSTRLSQNNAGTYLAQNKGTRGVHVALMGDPTLRMHPVAPPVRLTGQSSLLGVTLSWAAPQETSIEGYHVYRAASPEAPFVRISSAPVTGTAFTDILGSAANVYMVKTLKLEQCGSGSYHNASQGVYYPSFDSVIVPSPSVLSAQAVSSAQINLTWADNSAGTASFKLQRQSGLSQEYFSLANINAGVTSFNDKSVVPGTTYTYRVCATASGLDSAFSNPAVANTPVITISVPAAASFVGVDTTTKGSWKGNFGNDGFVIPGDVARYPSYAQGTVNSATYHEWNNATSDSRALLRADGNTRLASCYYSGTSYTIDLNFSDGQPHRLSLYMLDWDRNGRVQTIDIIDPSRGVTLDTRSASSFQEGLYYTWELKGKVQLRITRQAGYNGVIGGLFFDQPRTISGSSVLSLLPGSTPARIKINGQAGKLVEIQASNNLRDWAAVGTVVLGNGATEFSDSSAAGHRNRFYRVVQR